MEKPRMPMKIRYEYEQNQDLRLNYAHGVWGGLNAHGEVEMNFYTESEKLPPFSECAILPDGNLGEEVAPFDENVQIIARRIHSKVLLNYHAARSVLEWLEEKVELLEQQEAFSGIIDDGYGMAQ